MNLGNLDLKDLQEALKKAQQLMSSCTTITSEPKVEILADSISKDKKRLTTFELTFWRPLLPQLTRHRALSFSVRSSRATPSKVLIEEIRKSPWGPVVWGKNESGMVASKCYCDAQTVDTLKTLWINIALAMCNYVEGLEGVHKQIVNRILEPFSCTHAVVSGTEWNNFFKLRCADDSQPEMTQLALAMRKAMEESTPTYLKEDQWHLPYISQKDLFEYDLAECCKISAARCARVSYHLYDGTTDPEKDLELYEKLKTHQHCYSADTEVLTKNGWKYWPQVTYQDEIACIDQNTLEFLGFYKPMRLISYNYTGKMYSVDQQYCSFDVTEGHTMIGQVIAKDTDRYNYKYSPFVIGEYATKKSKKPNGLREMNIPLVPKVNTTLDPKGQLIGFYVGDGFFTYTTCMSFRLKKERKLQYLRDVLQKLHIIYSEKIKQEGVHEFTIKYSENTVEIQNLFEEIKSKCKCGARNKELGEWEYPLLAGIFDGLKHSDGSVTKDNTWRYCTYSINLLKDILRYAPLAGCVAKEIIKQKDAYNIFFKKYPLVRLNDSRRKKEKSQVQVREVKALPVYCAEVLGHGLIVRRNGKQMLCGNCSPMEHVATPAGDVYLISNFKGWNQLRKFEEM